jgi:hypothetical protein
MQIELSHFQGKHQTNPNRACKHCWEAAREALLKLEALKAKAVQS